MVINEEIVWHKNVATAQSSEIGYPQQIHVINIKNVHNLLELIRLFGVCFLFSITKKQIVMRKINCVPSCGTAWQTPLSLLAVFSGRWVGQHKKDWIVRETHGWKIEIKSERDLPYSRSLWLLFVFSSASSHLLLWYVLYLFWQNNNNKIHKNLHFLNDGRVFANFHNFSVFKFNSCTWPTALGHWRKSMKVRYKMNLYSRRNSISGRLKFKCRSATEVHEDR